MKKDTITLTRHDQHRIRVMTALQQQEVTVQEAADLLGRSVRQVRRIRQQFATDGPAGIIHGNRGRHPAHTLDQETRAQIEAWLRHDYAGVNASHAADLLRERQGLSVSRSTVQRIRVDAGLARPRTRRAPKHRSRRERRSRAGQLVQIDGSHHRWFGPDHPPCVLLAAIDDATSTVVAAHFREREDAAGYLTLLQQIVTTVGRPQAVYHDRHGIFLRSAKDPDTIAEQIANRRAPTQVGRALIELEIASIAAHAPQAKGRVERLFGTLQDRLVQEFALDGITTIAAAQPALERFLVRHNARFSVPAADAASAYRPLAPEQDVQHLCAFAYARRVAADNTVRIDRQTLQIAPAPDRSSFARCPVVVRQHLDGSLHVWWHDRRLTIQAAPPSASDLRALPGIRHDPFAQRHDPEEITPSVEPAPVTPKTPATEPHKPASDHPWRKPFKPERTFSQNS